VEQLSLLEPPRSYGSAAVWNTLDDKQKAAASAHRNDRQGERHAEDAASSRAKTAELARLITHGLRDVWSATKKLDAAMKMS